jgi:DNA-directed RNA polymerase subunit RPC12/RpoP
MKSKEANMKVICAWCKRELSSGKEDDDGPTSHGICPECYQKEIEKSEKPIRPLGAIVQG